MKYNVGDVVLVYSTICVIEKVSPEHITSTFHCVKTPYLIRWEQHNGTHSTLWIREDEIKYSLEEE